MIVFMLMRGLLVILILAKAINSIVVVVSFISVKLTSCPHGKKKKNSIPYCLGVKYCLVQFWKGLGLVEGGSICIFH